MGRKVGGELDRLRFVGSELNARYGYAVRPGVPVCFEDPASVNDFCVPVALFGVYAYTSECFDCRLC